MILAFGCSITHGCELVYTHQHRDNTVNSYPNLVANYLGTDCVNYSVCGISNEGIFHTILDKLPQHKTVDTIIVGWTSSMREYWRSNGRHWFVIPRWTATLKDLESEPEYTEDYENQDTTQKPIRTSDRQEYLSELSTAYNFITKHKFDEQEYKAKKRHYIESIRVHCASKNIKLIETANIEPEHDIKIFTDKIGKWRYDRVDHPNKLEHELIAKQITRHYYSSETH